MGAEQWKEALEAQRREKVKDTGGRMRKLHPWGEFRFELAGERKYGADPDPAGPK